MHSVTGRRGYALAYGSHARGTARTRSDLDLLAVGPDPLNATTLESLINRVKQLHHRHGLDLDQEVSYAMKLHATFSDVAAAVGFSGFEVSPAGELTIPPVAESPEFLNSRDFKLRLILNALTSPHVFLGGDLDRFAEDTAHARRALAVVAVSLHADQDVVAAPQAIDVLVTDPRTGATGQAYLGYTGADVPGLYGLVQLGFADLTRAGALRSIDGTRFAHCRNVRRTLLLTAAARSGRSPGRGIPSMIEQHGR